MFNIINHKVIIIIPVVRQQIIPHQRLQVNCKPNYISLPPPRVLSLAFSPNHLSMPPPAMPLHCGGATERCLMMSASMESRTMNRHTSM